MSFVGLHQNHALNGFGRGVRILGGSRGRLRELTAEQNVGSTGAPHVDRSLDRGRLRELTAEQNVGSGPSSEPCFERIWTRSPHTRWLQGTSPGAKHRKKRWIYRRATCRQVARRPPPKSTSTYRLLAFRRLHQNHALNGFGRGFRIRGASRGRLRELKAERNVGSTGAPHAALPRDANSASRPTFPHAAGQR